MKLSSILGLIVVLITLVNQIVLLGAQHSYASVIQSVVDDLSEKKKGNYGTLTGDVQNWATIIQNYIIQVSSYIN
jgi:hypothetical protein